MPLKEDLTAEVADIFRATWTVRDGTVVPETDSLKLANDAVRLDATVLYADLADSTSLVDDYKPEFAAEIYKTFLHCAAKIIRSEGGTITAYDGDRIMAVYLGDSKNTEAARTALKINYARTSIINPAIEHQYPSRSYRVRHVVGIDTSSLFVARTGIRGSNDLVWVGRAANYAAKLSALDPGYPSCITEDVYKRLNESLKVTDGKPMWERATWNTMNDIPIWRSTWWWSI